MCGSVFIELNHRDLAIRVGAVGIPRVCRTGDVRFTETATVLTFDKSRARPILENRIWGTLLDINQREEDSPVVYNARLETLKQRPSFAPSVEDKMYCALPVSEFHQRNFTFAPEKPKEVLWLAGIYMEDGSFLLCTRHTSSGGPIPREPVAIMEEDLMKWLAPVKTQTPIRNARYVLKGTHSKVPVEAL